MTDTEALHRKMFDTVAARDFAALRAMYHPDYTYTDAEGERKGADAGVEVAESYCKAMPDLKFEYRHQYAAGDDVSIIEFTVRGTHTGPLGDLAPTGKAVEMIVCNVAEVRDGLLYREREYYDTHALLKQLGVA